MAYHGSRFIKVFKKFFHSEVHGVMSDGAFRLWIHLLGEWGWKGRHLADVVTFPTSKQEEFGWSQGRFARCRDELLDLGVITIRPQDQPGRWPVNEPIRYNLEFDGSNGKVLDGKLQRGEIEPRQDGRLNQKRERDPVTGKFLSKKPAKASRK